MGIDVACPACWEEEQLTGSRAGALIRLVCESCGHIWDRDPSPRCPECSGEDLQEVVKAIVEKGRGTQLSVVGTRMVNLCRACDAEVLETYNRNLPNPLMPDRLPTVDPATG